MSSAPTTAPAAGVTAPSRRRLVAWPLLLALVLLEFLLFDQFGVRRVTPIYPRWNDQIQYLSEAYTGYESARVHGLAAGLWHTLVNPSAQGTLHDFAAVLVFKVAGPSRSAALALNMLALIAWQLALFAAVRRWRNTEALAFAVALLPLALSGPWHNLPGSAYDFRLDHLAMCALGVTSAVALCTDGLRRRGGAAALGLAVGITLLTRFLTGTYFVVIFGTAALWIAAGTERPRRWLNLLLAGAIAAAVAGPVFWVNREVVWNYYYIGHYVGPESAIRNQNFGLLRSSQFVWGWLAERHLGGFFALVALAVAAAFAGVRWVGRRSVQTEAEDAADDFRRPGRLRDGLFWGTTFLGAPALVLTLHPQKSEVVLGALVPGVILLVATGWAALLGGRRRGVVAPRALAGIAALAAVGVIVQFARLQRAPVETPSTIAALRQVSALADLIYARSSAQHLERPRVAVDYITDAFDGQVLRVLVYERHHVWLDFDMTLPTGIDAPDPQTVRERVTTSDFVFLFTDDQPGGPYPYDRRLAELRPELRTWCAAHRHAATTFPWFGRQITLYVK